jgi:hypothetical protein
MGAGAGYAMGLATSQRWGIPALFHDGALRGFRSSVTFLPDHGAGLVLLTNSGTSAPLSRYLARRWLEVLFDAAPEAEEDLAAELQRLRADHAAQRARLTVPADPSIIAKLASRYRSVTLGELQLKKRDAAAILDVGEWSTEIATRKNEDGTVVLVGITPRLHEEFIVDEREGKRVLVYREEQMEHVFVEAP